MPVKALGVIGILLGALVFAFIGSLWGGSIAGANQADAVGNVAMDGAQGPAGPAGADGLDGSDGAVGAVGPMGPRGFTGPAGTDGEDGADGLNGADGADGADGINGKDGADGMDGADGTDGPKSFAVERSGMSVELEPGGWAGGTRNLVTLPELPAGTWVLTATVTDPQVSAGIVWCYLNGIPSDPGDLRDMTELVTLSAPTVVRYTCANQELVHTTVMARSIILTAIEITG